MGMGSKIVSVVLRFVEFSSAIIVTSILGRYLHFLDAANVGAGSRIVYATVIGGLSIFFSLILILPFKYSFYAFPLDFALFICWMVAFGLLANLTSGRSCSSFWYWNSWGYYWGGYWRTVPHNSITAATVGSVGCGQWRSILAFSFLGGICWLANAFIVSSTSSLGSCSSLVLKTNKGLIVIANPDEESTVRADEERNVAENTSSRKRNWFKKEKQGGVAQSSPG
ncbi:MAG: hypothetical protein M1813_003132 [Trichoglossum hirsutum]|nr:MAG: hypothetical protein M1813_003132 [Trichoglossum hirsutum]